METTMTTTASSSSLHTNKRARDAAGVECSPAEGDAKRLRPEDLFDMLDEEADAAAAEDLASVMRSFEEEIAAGDGVAVAVAQPELGFLLEASDDELGLPPPGASSSDEAGAGEPEDHAAFGAQIWGFEDEIAYGGGYGVTSPEAAAAAAAAAAEWDDDGFDAGLFGFDDDACAPSDLAALRQETMPAI